jgi:hypothetical protein
MAAGDVRLAVEELIGQGFEVVRKLFRIIVGQHLVERFGFRDFRLVLDRRPFRFGRGDDGIRLRHHLLVSRLGVTGNLDLGDIGHRLGGRLLGGIDFVVEQLGIDLRALDFECPRDGTAVAQGREPGKARHVQQIVTADVESQRQQQRREKPAFDDAEPERNAGSTGILRGHG